MNGPMPPTSADADKAAGMDLRVLTMLVWRQRARVALATVLAAVVTLLVAFLLPRWYRASAVILPPEEADLMSNISLASKALTKFPSIGDLGSFFTPADIYKAILKSRTVQEAVVDRFQLMKVYRLKSREKTLKAFGRLSAVKLAPDGTILVSVEDRDPRRAADMAMAMLETLDRFNIEKRNAQARRTRLFLEKRLAETDSLLCASETALRSYQEVHHTVAPTAVSSASISEGADLMAHKIELEVKLGVLRGYLQEDNEQIIQVRNELEQLKRQIGVLPALHTDLARLIRDNKVQEQLFLLLTGELEQARIVELKQTPTVQILDPAVPPERPIRPRRLVLVLGAAALAFAASVLYVALGSPVARAAESVPR